MRILNYAVYTWATVLAYFELPIIHTIWPKMWFNPFRNGEEALFWVARQQNARVLFCFLCMCSVRYYLKWLEGHTFAPPPKTRFWVNVSYTEVAVICENIQMLYTFEDVPFQAYVLRRDLAYTHLGVFWTFNSKCVLN